VASYYSYGLSSHPEQKIIIEVDAEPQHFPYKPDKRIINKFDVFTTINVVPVDILLAQKIFSLLNRNRILGRDLYDIIFLLDKTKPNLGYLKEKIGIDDMENVRKLLISKCTKINLSTVANDVKPFLFDQSGSRKIELFLDYIKSF